MLENIYKAYTTGFNMGYINFESELAKIKWFSNADTNKLDKYKEQICNIASISGRTTYEIISEVNRLLSKSGENIESVIEFVDRRYRGKRKDDKDMSNKRYDAYDALSASALYYDLLKDRSRLVKNKFDKDTIKDVIFNNPATIVLWKDGTKTVVKCQTETDDTYNPELGLAMCIIKKCCNNKGNYNDVFNKWIPKATK